MYGGWDGSNKFNHLFIVELGRHSVVRVITSVCVCVCVCDVVCVGKTRTKQNKKLCVCETGSHS